MTVTTSILYAVSSKKQTGGPVILFDAKTYQAYLEEMSKSSVTAVFTHTGNVYTTQLDEHQSAVVIEVKTNLQFIGEPAVKLQPIEKKNATL